MGGENRVRRVTRGLIDRRIGLLFCGGYWGSNVSLRMFVVVVLRKKSSISRSWFNELSMQLLLVTPGLVYFRCNCRLAVLVGVLALCVRRSHAYDGKYWNVDILFDGKRIM